MPGWGAQGGERSQPFVLSCSQLFFTCASFHNNQREFNFNVLARKNGGGLGGRGVRGGGGDTGWGSETSTVFLK